MGHRIVGGYATARGRAHDVEFPDAKELDEMVEVFRRDAGALLGQWIGTVVGAPRIADDAVARLSECRLLIAPDQRAAGSWMHEYDRSAIATRVPVPKTGIGQCRQRLFCRYWSGERRHEVRARVWCVLGRRGSRRERREQGESNPF